MSLKNMRSYKKENSESSWSGSGKHLFSLWKIEYEVIEARGGETKFQLCQQHRRSLSS